MNLFQLTLRFWRRPVGFAALLLGSFPAVAQTAPPLGVNQQFSVLGNSAVTGSTGVGTLVSGDVGSSPTASVTNFPPSAVSPPFTLHLTNDLTVQQAHSDAVAAYNFLAAEGPGTVLAAQLDGAVLTSGIFSFAGGAADLAAGGTLTLNGPGIFVFQVDSALTANVFSNVVGTADPCSIFWRVGTSAILNGISFRGNVLADASITIGSGSNVTGRALAGTGPTGAVTMAGSGGNTIGGCATITGPPPPPIAIPVLDPLGLAILFALLAGGGLWVVKRRSA
ncbi:MAG: ice-binding family protein [Acidobacteriota bacterium]